MNSVVGIHPTVAEDMIGLDKTKEKEPNAEKSGCWAWARATGWTIQWMNGRVDNDKRHFLLIQLQLPINQE